MSIIGEAFRGGLWLGGFKAGSQLISWIATILVARLLTPDDYGLMQMATIFTGYAQLFLELGLGAAIVQKARLADDELHSLFIFILGWGALLALLCLALATPTALVFDEPELIPLTRSVGLIFLLSAATVVPRNLLQRQMRFKALGAIEASAVVLSCLGMILMAQAGLGVWTLIGGLILRGCVSCTLLLIVARWRPRAQFSYQRVRPFIGFGLNLVAAQSLHYIYNRADSFFGARALGANGLGYYALAMQLAEIPTTKLVSVVNSVAFPVFVRMQTEAERGRRFYLQLIEFLALITVPLYLGAIFVADPLIRFVLGAHWLPAVPVFQILCAAQILIAINTPNAVIHVANNRPRWLLYVNLVQTPVMVCAFWLAAQAADVRTLALPWLSVYPLVQIVFIHLTLDHIGIRWRQYFASLRHPFLAGVGMLLCLAGFELAGGARMSDPVYLACSLPLGALSYGAYMLAFRRPLLIDLWALRRAPPT